jgi:two-component system, LytTR family, response regulator
MRILIVDDEPLARKALERAVLKRSDVESYDVAVDAIQALDKLLTDSYDVVLLDIAMPELSGMELVERLKKSDQPPPAIVFVTAHDDHAVQAFEKRAVDYVLKPFATARIQEAIDHAKQRTAAQKAAVLAGALPNVRSTTKAKLAIKTKGRILLIDPAEVVSVRAEGNYVLLERKNGTDILRESISAVAGKLKPFGFVRIHRSVLINSAFVEELQPLFSGDYTLKIKGGREYMVSRSYKKNLADMAELWIGAEAFTVKEKPTP